MGVGIAVFGAIAIAWVLAAAGGGNVRVWMLIFRKNGYALADFTVLYLLLANCEFTPIWSAYSSKKSYNLLEFEVIDMNKMVLH
jgi:hypothetical protein